MTAAHVQQDPCMISSSTHDHDTDFGLTGLVIEVSHHLYSQPYFFTFACIGIELHQCHCHQMLSTCLCLSIQTLLQ